MPTPLREQTGVAATVSPEREIRPFNHALGVKLVENDSFEKFSRGQIQEPTPRLKHDDLARPGVLQEVNLAVDPKQGGGSLLRAKEHDGVRVERQDQARGLMFVGKGSQAADQVAMAKVNAIEVSHREV